jgi:hypothetical protein
MALQGTVANILLLLLMLVKGLCYENNIPPLISILLPVM